MTPEQIARQVAEEYARDWMSFAFPRATQSAVDQFIERQRGLIPHIAKAIAHERDRAQLESQMTRVLEEALAWYANPKSWAAHTHARWNTAIIGSDHERVDRLTLGGKRAREALERVAQLKMREALK